METVRCPSGLHRIRIYGVRHQILRQRYEFRCAVILAEPGQLFHENRGAGTACFSWQRKRRPLIVG